MRARTAAAFALLLAAAASPAEAGSDRGVVVHPGSAVRTQQNSIPGAPFGSTCTLGFLFRAAHAERYMLTAGHCVTDPTLDGPPNDVRWPSGSGPSAFDSQDRRIGEFVWVVSQNQLVGKQDHDFPVGIDFGLIRLDNGVQASASMCHFGGPTRINDSITDDPVVIHHYGQGVGVSAVHDPYTQTGIAARTGVAPLGLPRSTYFNAVAVGSSGDSGSPVTDADGAALGVLTGAPIPVNGEIEGVNDPTGTVTRIGPIVELVERELGVRLHLATAPVARNATEVGGHDLDCR